MKAGLYSKITFGLFVCILLAGCSRQKPSEPIHDEPFNPEKEWTFLFYDDAEFGQAYDPMDDFARFVSSGEAINYIVLRDRVDSKASYYQIGSKHEKKLLKNIGEADMSDQKSLSDFMEYAKEHFPAKRYIVAFYDHGGGWAGACFDATNDMTNSNTALTPVKLNDAFTKFGGVDLVLFTAPCLMGSLETVYQVRNSVKCYIASEDVSGFIYWFNMLTDFDYTIKYNPAISTEELSQRAIELLYTNRNDFGNRDGERITMSAVRPSKVGEFVSSFDSVTDYYLRNPEVFKSHAREFKNYGDSFTDVFDLLGVLLNYETDTQPRELITNAMKHFNECIIKACRGSSNARSYGLNIYFPKVCGPELYYAPLGTGLEFNSNTSWGHLVLSYLSPGPSSVNKGIFRNVFKFNGFKPSI